MQLMPQGTIQIQYKYNKNTGKKQGKAHTSKPRCLANVGKISLNMSINVRRAAQNPLSFNRDKINNNCCNIDNNIYGINVSQFIVLGVGIALFYSCKVYVINTNIDRMFIYMYIYIYV